MSFEEFVAGYGRSLLRPAFVLSGDRQAAEDLTQTGRGEARRSAGRRGASLVCQRVFPTALAGSAFAFDGTVTGIGPARTERRPEPGALDLRSVTFRVHAWFKGGSVSGMPRRGGAPLDAAIAWGCGFTRYHSPAMAAEWAAATR